jgi:MYXO-CTERM domain-containing protein
MNIRIAIVRAAVAATAVTAATTASAGYTITQQNAPAPTYSTTLNFDEPGAPTGVLPGDTWAPLGITEMVSGVGDPVVGDFSGTFPWINSGNALAGPFGVFMTFETPMTEMSLQVWDPSGEPSFFGGGLNIFLFNNGEQVWDLFEQNGDIATPAWGGLGDSWFDITTTDGMVFDEVRILGFGFGAETFIDNLSWNPIPTPGAVGVLGLAAFAGTRRRRA